MSDKVDFYLRIANKSDSEKIFKLSNEDNVRENSINPDKITWKNHLTWLNDTLKSKDSLVLVGMDNNDQFIGQVYYKIENNKAFINISIDEDYRGMDLAAPIINKSTEVLFAQQNQIETILAYIKEINIPSLKAFEQAGFLFYKHEIINDNKFFVYRYLRN